ncbi:nickel-dependent lactate racemase [bacterium]|nr:nickel-dependent lactate racemase [bacterium]
MKDTASVLELPYGSGVQRAEVPHSWKLRTLSSVPHAKGRAERSIVMDTLDAPINAPALEDFVRPGERVLILVSDKTRRCRTDLFLPILLERLALSGVKDDDITILFATGTHPAQSEEEQRAILGDEVYRRYTIREHDARDISACVHVGTTAAGTDIHINRLVAEADRVIATGTIVHHYFAGFGGGAKLFVPGVASYETAVANHRRTITAEGSFHPGCADGRIEGNPVITDILDAFRFMPPTWYFAALLDEQGSIADAVCGDLLSAHDEGCRRVEAQYGVPLDSRADLVIVSTGGFPKDINFIQSHKSLHHASYATRKGGHIVFLAECREGIGNEALLPWFDIPAGEQLRNALLERYAMNAHTALAMREKAWRFGIRMLTAMDGLIVRRLGMQPVNSLQQAIDVLKEELPDDADVLILPNGSLVVPRPVNA